MIGPYETDSAFRSALEDRLKAQATTSGVSLDRLRRRVTVERALARLAVAQPDRWVLKGGMALELRLTGDARATKDLDLGLRLSPPDAQQAADLLADALDSDLGDGFHFSVSSIEQLGLDGIGDICRASVTCRLAGKEWGAIKVDIGIRPHELGDTEGVRPTGALAFVGIEPPTVETISLPRHVAEKFHGMTKDFDDRENSRTRDLVDIVLLAELGLIDEPATAAAIAQVFEQRSTAIPTELPSLPGSWAGRYEASAAEHHIHPASFPDAVTLVAALWARLVAP